MYGRWRERGTTAAGWNHHPAYHWRKGALAEAAQLANAVDWVARAHAPGASPHTRLLPQDWVVVMRRSGVCRVRRWMSVSEHEGNGDEGRSGRVRAPVCVELVRCGRGCRRERACVSAARMDRASGAWDKGCVHASSASPGGNLMCRSCGASARRAHRQQATGVEILCADRTWAGPGAGRGWCEVVQGATEHDGALLVRVEVAQLRTSTRR